MSSSNRNQEASFANLPIYLHNLKQTNPHSVTSMKLDVNGHFEFCFVSLGCVLHAFLSCTLPVMIVGSAPVKGNCLRTMFIASTLDGNKQKLPVAFGFGISENPRNWEWFLTRLRDCLRDIRDIAFICNFDGCIEPALANVFPNSYRGYCCQSIYRNLIARCKKARRDGPLFWWTCKAYTKNEFQQYFDRLKHAIPRQAHWLDSIGNEKWARSYFPDNRFSIMTGQFPEATSLPLFNEENVPITTLIDAVRDMMQTIFNQRSQYGDVIATELTPYANGVFIRRGHKGFEWRPRKVNDLTFEVTHHVGDVTLDFRTKRCSCGKWRTTGIPCRHAIVTAATMGFDHSDDFQIYFFTSVYRATYQQGTVHPLPPPIQWEMPNEMTVVLPPTTTYP